MSFGLQVFTLVHVLLSLVGIFTGFVALFGQLALKPRERWTAWFLATTVLTNATGFGFPVDRVLPSHALALISLLLLTAAIYARYARGGVGVWPRVYTIAAVAALYINVLVLVVQLFLRVPAMHELAPTGTEAPFVVSQLIVLAAFVALGIGAVKRLPNEP